MKTDKILLSLDQMAEKLNIKPEALKQRIYRDKKVPHFKIGGALRFDKEAVLNHFKRA